MRLFLAIRADALTLVVNILFSITLMIAMKSPYQALYFKKSCSKKDLNKLREKRRITAVIVGEY